MSENTQLLWDAELLEFGSILISTKSPHTPGDVLLGDSNCDNPGATDVRIVAEAPRGSETWAERKPVWSQPRYEFFYYAVPATGEGRLDGQATEAGEPCQEHDGMLAARRHQPMEALTQESHS